MTPKEFNEMIAELESGYTKRDDSYICKKCGSTIMSLFVSFSIHDGFSIFGQHAGGGEVRRVSIPFCPKCDKEPETEQCLDY